MTERVNGGVSAGEFLTGDMQFFTIRTLHNMTQGAWGSANSANRNLDVLIRTILRCAQPVMLNVSQATVSNPSTGAGMGSNFTASATVYTVRFAIEKAGALDGLNGNSVDVNSPSSLANMLQGLVLPFTSPVPATNVMELVNAASRDTNVAIAENL